MILPVLFLAAASLLAQAPPPPPPSYKAAPAEIQGLQASLDTLAARIERIRPAADPALVADVEICHKAVEWALRFPEEFYTRVYLDNARKLLAAGITRADELAAAKPSWVARTGRTLRAYRSRVDASVQPYAVYLPPSYDPAKPHRLDLVLHGRGSTLTEVSFAAQHDDLLAAANRKPAPLRDGVIEVHVFGRTNNAYRWAGETDVFEALASARSRYAIDPNRIVLRGFSMGGAGAWHIGLHYPDRWAAVEAGAGFNETRRYAKLAEPIPDYIARTLHIYDAFEYARNAYHLPVVGYGGEIDPQLQASKNIQAQLEQEKLPGLRALFLVGPNTPHRWHPDSLAQANAFIDAEIAKPRGQAIRFVTYTTQYGEIRGYRIEGLEKHYERAELDVDGGHIRTRNVALLRLPEPAAVTIDGQTFKQPVTLLQRRGTKWRSVAGPQRMRKSPGLQGPIDDAFREAFLCVRPTGKPFNEEAHKFLLSRLAAFQRDFAKYMRGDIAIKDDTAVTEADIRDRHLILFGDTRSNILIGRVVKNTPLDWEPEWIKIGNVSFAAIKHVPTLIYPNPLNPAKYIVINSGHTFGEAEFKGTNALLYPRLGDWAILDLDAPGRPAAAGLFDDFWRLP